MDLLDLYRGRLSLRKLAVLIRQLPADSATARAISPVNEWTTTDYLIAQLIDVGQYGNYIAAAVAGNKVKPPTPYPRPGDQDQKPTSAVAETAEDFRAFMNS